MRHWPSSSLPPLTKKNKESSLQIQVVANWVRPMVHVQNKRGRMRGVQGVRGSTMGRGGNLDDALKSAQMLLIR